MGVAQQVRRRAFDKRAPHERHARRHRERRAAELHGRQSGARARDRVEHPLGHLILPHQPHGVGARHPGIVAARPHRGRMRGHGGRAADERHPSARRIEVARLRRLLQVHARARRHDAHAIEMGDGGGHAAGAVVQRVVVRRAHHVEAEPAQFVGRMRADHRAEAAAGRGGHPFAPRGNHQFAIADGAVRLRQQRAHRGKGRFGEAGDPARENDVAGQHHRQRGACLRHRAAGARGHGRTGHRATRITQERPSIHQASQSLSSRWNRCSTCVAIGASTRPTVAMNTTPQ